MADTRILIVRGFWPAGRTIVKWYNCSTQLEYNHPIWTNLTFLDLSIFIDNRFIFSRDNTIIHVCRRSQLVSTRKKKSSKKIFLPFFSTSADIPQGKIWQKTKGTTNSKWKTIDFYKFMSRLLACMKKFKRNFFGVASNIYFKISIRVSGIQNLTGTPYP